VVEGPIILASRVYAWLYVNLVIRELWEEVRRNVYRRLKHASLEDIVKRHALKIT
jgi:DNA-binding IscR family transcriptional regulator